MQMVERTNLILPCRVKKYMLKRRVRSRNVLQVLMLECTSCGAQGFHDPL